MKEHRIVRLLSILMLVGLLAACQTGPQTTEGESPESGRAAAGTRAKPKPPAEQTVKVTVPAGTALSIRLVDAIDTGKTAEGSAFEGTLASALVVNNVQVAAVGSKVSGKVTHVVSSGRLTRPAELALVLTSMTPAGGKETAIATEPWSMKGESHKKRNIGMIGGGAGAGAVIGAIAGGKKGAAIGGAVGAGTGTGVAAATGKQEIELPPETPLSFKLSSPVTLSVKK